MASLAFETTMCVHATNIVDGTCIPWGAYSSFAVEKTITSLLFFSGISAAADGDGVLLLKSCHQTQN